MAPEQKLKRLPTTHRRSKRPLLRPPIPSPYTNASQPKIVYVSASTPFISAVKRVRKLLNQAEKRTLGKASLLDKDNRSDKQKLQAIAVRYSDSEPVYLRATGRAIEKGLNLAFYFQNQQDCRVQIKTGTVGTVDDIVEKEDAEITTKSSDDIEVDAQDPRGSGSKHDGDTETALPETQIRKASFVEVAVRLKLD